MPSSKSKPQFTFLLESYSFNACVHLIQILHTPWYLTILSPIFSQSPNLSLVFPQLGVACQEVATCQFVNLLVFLIRFKLLDVRYRSRLEKKCFSQLEEGRERTCRGSGGCRRGLGGGERRRVCADRRIVKATPADLAIFVTTAVSPALRSGQMCRNERQNKDDLANKKWVYTSQQSFMSNNSRWEVQEGLGEGRISGI